MTKPIIFIQGTNPAEAKGGGSNYVRMHARAACLIGFEPHIFCPAPRDGIIETDFGVVHLVAAPLRLFGGIWSATYTPFLAASVERFLLTREGPHLIHGFVWHRTGLIVRRRLASKGIRTVAINSLYTTAWHEARAKLEGLTPAHSAIQRWRYRIEALWTKQVINREERQMYREADLLCCNYESVRRLFLDQYGPGAEVRALPYTSELAFIHENGAAPPEMPPEVAALKRQGAPLIVAVSRHDPRKGIDLLLHALAELRAAGAEFRACLVGGGPLLESHRRLAGRLRLEDVIAITGWVPDPFDYLCHADLFVLPSIQEGSGSVSLIEALQAGLPVIASNIDGIPEDVTDGESALLIEPGNVAALARALGRVLTDSALRQKLARCAREVFDRKFSPEVSTGALREVYAELGFTP
ncbi:MAG TPA: glycosyltransferase family 4 protein [Blastocatellia bacterium]|nr:glycosyltransferase family 4 protein [Blastocatellia bacterium]